MSLRKRFYGRGPGVFGAKLCKFGPLLTPNFKLKNLFFMHRFPPFFKFTTIHNHKKTTKYKVEILWGKTVPSKLHLNPLPHPGQTVWSKKESKEVGQASLS